MTSLHRPIASRSPAKPIIAAAVLFAAFQLAHPLLVRADQQAAPSPFSVNLKVEIPLLISGVALTWATDLFVHQLPPPHCDPCDPADVNSFDRGVIGNDSSGARGASDVFMYTIPVLAIGSAALSLPEFGWRGLVEDIVVIGEAAVLAGAMQQIVAMASRRPRPYMYVEGLRPDVRSSPNSSFSFFSGHVSVPYAAATAAAYVYSTRHTSPTAKWLPWVLAALIPAPLPFLRVASGDHFWTDVLAGVAVGVASGLLVPYLHDRSDELQASGVKVSITASPGGLGLAGRF